MHARVGVSEKNCSVQIDVKPNLILSYFGWVSGPKKIYLNLHRTKSGILGEGLSQETFFGLTLYQTESGVISVWVGGWVQEKAKRLKIQGPIHVNTIRSC